MPFSRKLTPAALPALTMISRVARTEVCAGAMRVSRATCLPSASIEIQVDFSARIKSVKEAGGFAAAGLAVFAADFFGALGLGDGAGDFVVKGAAAADWVGKAGGVVFAEMAPVDDVPADKVFGEDSFSTVNEPVEPEGCVAINGGAEAGAGV